MKYQHEQGDQDYTPYASGVVFHSLGGHPPLPVRLSSEIFLKAYALWGQRDASCTLYDPLCGSGATLATLKFLHWTLIKRLIGSDISARALEIAALNFRLLTPDGMQQRIEKLRADAAEFGKTSHQEAAEAALMLAERIADPVETHLFLADAIDRAQLEAGLNGELVDIAMLDIPYGGTASWGGDANAVNSEIAAARVLEALRAVMSPAGIAAVFMPKKHKIEHLRFERIQRIKVGKREVWLLRSK